MGVIMKIRSISPSSSTCPENRTASGKKNLSGKTCLSRGGLTFDECLEAQLKDMDFAWHLYKFGQKGFLIRKKSSASMTQPVLSISLYDIIPELHIPFHAYNTP